MNARICAMNDFVSLGDPSAKFVSTSLTGGRLVTVSGFDFTTLTESWMKELVVADALLSQTT
jgi:hypothetical protein